VENRNISAQTLTYNIRVSTHAAAAAFERKQQIVSEA
jgi:hypothetical protein